MQGTTNVENYLTIREVSESLKVSKSTLWRWIKAGLFPKPVHLGPKAVRWRVSDLAAWNRGKTEATS